MNLNRFLLLTSFQRVAPLPLRLLRIRFSSTQAENLPRTNEKLIKVAIVGVPNVGKSTLINGLTENRVCPVSNKVHTTRDYSRAITVKKSTQVVLFDTPGLITDLEAKKHKLETAFETAPRYSIKNADIIGVVHDVSNSFTRHALHPVVLDILEAYKSTPSILILNKIDRIRVKRVLLDLVKQLTCNRLGGKQIKAPKSKGKELPFENETNKRGWPHFSDVFMVSALTGDGLDKLMEFVTMHGKDMNWEFPPDKTTDQTPEELIVKSTQARLLDYLPQEIPYYLRSELEFFSQDDGKIYASVVVHCPNERIERLVCGVGDGKLKQITERITSDLVETFSVAVSLTIITKSPSKEKAKEN